MTEAFDKIMAGLKDARAYLDGGRDGFVVHQIDVRGTSSTPGVGQRTKSEPPPSS